MDQSPVKRTEMASGISPWEFNKVKCLQNEGKAEKRNRKATKW